MRTLLAGAILLHPSLPLVPTGAPFLSSVPIFIGAGLQNPYTPAQDIVQLRAIFEAAGADVTLFWRRGAATLQVHEVAFAREWLQSGSRYRRLTLYTAPKRSLANGYAESLSIRMLLL